ncbi:MAG: sialidase family protein [Candidatus Methylomirabilales bacterium]
MNLHIGRMAAPQHATGAKAKIAQAGLWSVATGFFVAVCLLMLGTICDAAWAGGPPDKEISLVNISQTTASFVTGVPQVAVSRYDPDVVAVSWRLYGLPINTNADVGARTADCHVAISTNGGKTFHDTNLMPILREHVDPELPTQPAPGLYFCNFSWVTIGPDRTIYAGGAMFTPLGTIGPAPKQGRAMLTVSRDDGRHWSPATYGIKFANFAPGLTGLSNGTAPEDTPWDNAMGIAAPRSATFYSEASGYVVASDDRAETFGTVYKVNVPGWTFSLGTLAASGNMLVAPIIASKTPLAATCPCLAVATSIDKGKTWTAQLVAEAAAFNPSGSGDTARYPFAAADPHFPWKYAVAAYTPDRTSVQVFYTENGGYTWKSASVGPVPTGVPIVRAGKIGLGFTTDGEILVVWRGFQAPDNPNVAGGPGPFNTFAALLHGNSFGPTIRVSPESSTYPSGTTVGSTAPGHADFNLNNGGGDYSTWITGNDEFAFVAFPYAPGGLVLDTYFAKIPLTMMTPGCHDRECGRGGDRDHDWDHDRR